MFLFCLADSSANIESLFDKREEIQASAGIRRKVTQLVQAILHLRIAGGRRNSPNERHVVASVEMSPLRSGFRLPFVRSLDSPGGILSLARSGQAFHSEASALFAIARLFFGSSVPADSSIAAVPQFGHIGGIYRQTTLVFACCILASIQVGCMGQVGCSIARSKLSLAFLWSVLLSLCFRTSFFVAFLKLHCVLPLCLLPFQFLGVQC